MTAPRNPEFERVAAALRGRYTLLRELGHGGMGTVYLARDVKLKREVAIKVLLPAMRAALGTDRFEREVELVSRLSHPHIVPLFEADETDGILFFVMEYVAGETVQDRLARDGPMPLEDALRIVAEVGDALQYAHDHGTIHRDVKPANILLAGGHALLADFGIAKSTDPAVLSETLTTRGAALGTIPYMSPEQACGERRIDARSDVYSLAAVLYEMLVGEPPFTGPSTQAIIARICSESPRSIRTVRSTIPGHIDAAVAAGLAKVAADRPRSALAFLEHLMHPQTPEVPRSRRHWMIGGAVGVIAVATIIAWGAAPWENRTARGNSIAVLYFDYLSGDTSDVYLAHGLTEEMITRLGQSQRLLVTSRNAVSRHRGSTVEPAALGRSLGVAYLLSGSVRRGTNSVRVAVELVRTSNGVRIWGDSYDLTNSDPLEIQQLIAATVTQRIAGQLTRSESRAFAAYPTGNREAYDHFLRGLYYMRPRDVGGLLRALEEFGSAVRLDPVFAQAHARVGLAYLLLRDQSDDVAKNRQWLAQGAAALDRSLHLDSTISDAWVGRGRFIALERGTFDPGVLASYERAIALDPRNADAHHFYAINVLHNWADWNRALPALRAAAALEPDRLVTLANIGSAEFSARQVHEALRWWDSVIALRPIPGSQPQIGSLINRSIARLVVLKDTVGARVDAEELRRAGNPVAAHVIMALLELRRGDTAAARTQFDLSWSIAGWSATRCGALPAVVLVEFGEHERALDCIEHIDRSEVSFVILYLSYPFFDRIRSDVRFQRTLERLGPPQGTVPTHRR